MKAGKEIEAMHQLSAKTKKKEIMVWCKVSFHQKQSVEANIVKLK